MVDPPGLSRPLQCLRLSSSRVAVATPPLCIRHHLDVGTRYDFDGKETSEFHEISCFKQRNRKWYHGKSNDLVHSHKNYKVAWKKPLAKAPGRKRWDASRPRNVLHLTCWTSWLFFAKPFLDGHTNKMLIYSVGSYQVPPIHLKSVACGLKSTWTSSKHQKLRKLNCCNLQSNICGSRHRRCC